MSLAIDPNNPDILYAGTAGAGIFKSVNGGISWQASGIGMDPNEPIGTVVVAPTASNILYAGSWVSGIFISENAGQTWQLLNDGLSNKSIRTLSIATDGELLYAGTRGEGVFRLGELVVPNLDQNLFLPAILKQ
jgi:photosystem II stability/assembly factor-like uncharacterized protein